MQTAVMVMVVQMGAAEQRWCEDGAGGVENAGNSDGVGDNDGMKNNGAQGGMLGDGK